MLDLRVLKYFLTVAREENITRAAALLHVTQPTLSRQLMQLEDELGVKLFRRSRYRIVLTDEGMLLRRRAQELVDLAEKTQQEFSHAAELAGTLSIGSGDLRSMDYLASLLASFRAENPLVSIEIYSGDSDNIKQRIESGSLDIGLLVEPVDISKYEFQRLPVRESWGAYVRADSPLADLPALTPEILSQEPLIVSSRELIRRESLGWFGEYAERIEIAAKGNLPYNQTALVRRGLGVFICPALDCEFTGIRFVPLDPPLEFATVLAWKKAETAAPVTDAFLSHIKARLQ